MSSHKYSISFMGVTTIFNRTFYHATMKKYVAVFGTLFNQISIDRTDANGTTIETMKVPLEYGPREKFLARTDSDPNLNRPYSISLPRMAFELKGYNYDGTRKLSSTHRFLSPMASTDPQKTVGYQSVYMPVPYDFSFELNICVKNAEDGTRILEQILPYFTPDFTPSVYPIAGMDNLRFDIPIVHESTTTTDTYEADFKTRRVLIHTLGFRLKGYLFGPVSKSAVIKFATVNIKDGDSGLTLDTVTVQPGLTANGQPTNDITLTIPYSDIQATDNWDYVVETYSPIGDPDE